MEKPKGENRMEKPKVRALLYGGISKTKASCTMQQIAERIYRIDTPNGFQLFPNLITGCQKMRCYHIQLRDREGHPIVLYVNLDRLSYNFVFENNAEAIEEEVLKILDKVNQDGDGLIIDTFEDILRLPRHTEILHRIGQFKGHICLIARDARMPYTFNRHGNTWFPQRECLYQFRMKPEVHSLTRFIDFYIQMAKDNHAIRKQYGAITACRYAQLENFPISVEFKALQTLIEKAALLNKNNEIRDRWIRFDE